MSNYIWSVYSFSMYLVNIVFIVFTLVSSNHRSELRRVCLPLPWPRFSSQAGRLRGVWYPAPQRWTRCPNETAHHPQGRGQIHCNTRPAESRETKYGNRVRNTASSTPSRLLLTPNQTHTSTYSINTVSPESTLKCRTPDRGGNQYIFHEIFGSAYHSVKTNAIYSQSSTVCIDQSLSFVTGFTAVVINLAVLWVSGILR